MSSMVRLTPPFSPLDAGRARRRPPVRRAAFLPGDQVESPEQRRAQ